MTNLRFGLTEQAIEMLDYSYNELLKITVEETEETMGRLYVIANTALAYLEDHRPELVVIRLVRYSYHVRHHLDNACEDMYRFLRLFFWMYHYDTSKPCTEEEYFEVQELDKIFYRLRFFFMQGSALFTKRDCVNMMYLITSYYYGCHINNDSMDKIKKAETLLYTSLLYETEEIFQEEANKGWLQVMDYVEERSRYFEKKKTSNELEEIDRERIRKEEPMKEMVQDELPANMVICDKCGKVISKYEGSVFDETNEHWCRECANEFLEEHDDYVRCYQCSTIVPKDEATLDSAGDWFCQECADNYLTTCDDCGRIVWVEDCYWVESEEMQICPSCYDARYASCTVCGTIQRVSDMQEYDGEYYCERHFEERFTTCDECGEIIPIDDAHEIDGYNYCDSCYEEKRGSIFSWHDDKVRYHINNMPGEDYLNEVTIGIEHEVGCYEDRAGEYSNDLYYIMNKERGTYDNMYICNDSSVEGFEIISQPMTIRYFNEVYFPKYLEAFDYMKSHSFNGEDEGGMHIHFRIPCLNKYMVARLNNIIYGTMDDIEILTRISRRTCSSFERWCDACDRKYSTQEILDRFGSPDRAPVYKAVDGRNVALNWDGNRTETYELRMFNSTMDIQKYLASVEFVIALTDFVRIDTEFGVYTTLRQFVDYINHNKVKYPHIDMELEELDVYDTYEIRRADNTSLIDMELDDFDVKDIKIDDEAFSSLYPDGVVEDTFPNLSETDRLWIDNVIEDVFSRV